jgi:hypothetical protein
LLAAALLPLAACGDDDDNGTTTTEAEAEASTPQAAIAEAVETQNGLKQAEATYVSGDQAAAADQVSETYLQHFELVEPALEEVNPELNEELEHQIREELVASMEAGDPVAKVKAQINEIDAGLAEATKQLQGAA